MDPIEAHRRAQAVFGSKLQAVDQDQLTAPTPCTDWTVRELIEHVAAGNWRVAGNQSRGLPEDIEAIRDEIASSARAAMEALEAPRALEQEVEMPFGRIPGSLYVRLRSVDVATHAWDLARATAQPRDFDPELAEELLEWARQVIRPEQRGPGKAFGLEQPCPPEASPADRLACFLGRSAD